METKVLWLFAFCIVVCAVGKEQTSKTEVTCPEGWLITDFFTYSSYNGNVPTCFICRRNSVLYHPFSFVEICLVYMSPKNLYYEKLSKLTLAEYTEKRNIEPFCGASLSFISSRKMFHVDKVVPCQKSDYLITSMKQTVDLLCPRSYEFYSIQERNVTFHDDYNTFYYRTYCVVCRKFDNPNQTNSTITMCPYRDNHWFHESKYSIKMVKIEQCDRKECEPHTIPKIVPDLHCGSIFSLKSGNTEEINTSNFILCSEQNIDEHQVKFKIFSGNINKIIVSYHISCSEKCFLSKPRPNIQRRSIIQQNILIFTTKYILS